jgi:hypothetical protein
MKWVIAAIVVFIAGYTAVNYFYRKPGPAFRPYEDMNQRATTARLLQAGWQKTGVELQRPIEGPSIGLAAKVARGSPGLGHDLAAAFAAKPGLLSSIDRVTAADQVRQGEPYRVHFSATVRDQRLQVADAELLRRGSEIVLLPETEKIPGDRLLTRWPDLHYVAHIPTDSLAPGTYRFRILSEGPAAEWEFVVR